MVRSHEPNDCQTCVVWYTVDQCAAVIYDSINVEEPITIEMVDEAITGWLEYGEYYPQNLTEVQESDMDDLVGCAGSSGTIFHSHSRQSKAEKRRHSRVYVEFFQRRYGSCGEERCLRTFLWQWIEDYHEIAE